MKFIVLALCLGFLGCQSSPTSSVKPAPLGGYPTNLGATPLLTNGYNRSAVFSLDGSKVYFISKGRRDHRNSQVYEYDLSLNTERRVTFQDGEVFEVSAAPETKFYYSSNTDEIKEQPFAKDLDPRFPRAEIYRSDRFGDQIDRITNVPGFDGEMNYVETKKSVLFTSIRSGIAGLYWLNPENFEIAPWSVGKNLARSSAVSPDGQTLYWVEEGPSKHRTQAIVKGTLNGKERVAIRSVVGVIKSLSVGAGGLVAYAWQPKGSDYSQIDLYNPESSCNRVLLKSKMDFLEPQFSRKNSQVLLFRGALGENSVVYRWELPEALGPCVP